MKELCRQVFGEDVERGVYPRKKQIVESIEKYPQLHQRPPEAVVARLRHVLKNQI